MNRICYLLVSALIIIGFSNCSNDFDVTTGGTNSPVVYGFLSPKDTATYIRIERAFVDASTSALVLSQQPEQLFFEDIEVTLSSGGSTFTLNRVDGAEEGLPRDPGIFVSSPNFLYKLVLPPGEPFIEGDEYELTITDNVSDTIITSVTTKIVDEPVIIFPPEGDDFSWGSSIEAQNDIRTEWRRDIDNAAIFDVRVQINYQEAIDGDIDNLVNKSAVFNVNNNIEPDDEDDTLVQVDVLATDILGGIGANVDPTGPGPRIFQSLEVIVDAGSQDLLSFINIGQANTGLTGATVAPIFSNVPGGFGLFSSRNSASVGGLILEDEALDSLIDGRFTSQLNFR